ncbi:NAD(P)H-dependent glycerol-3-phosphate dehydrogenase [Parasediminibacterium sp. JCM 36343]|uniref:NAD(P)H-dependent glycerol-3-phosphate dehydrogenase n=1 Tax=Parasediminibacterium sp. JCM 36343 TaxID=3374279 RepID=UPI003978BBFB
MTQFGIIGSGSWATALAKILTDNGNKIHWWIRNSNTIAAIKKRKHNPHYLGAAYFDTHQLLLNNNIEEVVAQSDILVIAIPSAYTIDALAVLPKDAFIGKKIVSAIKGILPDTNQLLNEYLLENFNVAIEDYFTVLGPCHAEEVASEKLSYLTFSGIDEAFAAQIAKSFATEYIKTKVNHDILGVQYAAVLKNIYALGAGIAHGLEYGDNFLSVYIANCAHEMAGFCKKMVWDKESEEEQRNINYSASVYLGDLLVTCYSLYSRNRTFGNMIGKGYSVTAAQLELNMVAEGYNASKCIYKANELVQAAMPIATAIYQILWEQLPVGEGFKLIEGSLV